MNDKNPWLGKRVLITGVCGTVGRELLEQIKQLDPEEIVGIDNNEQELFFFGSDTTREDFPNPISLRYSGILPHRTLIQI